MNNNETEEFNMSEAKPVIVTREITFSQPRQHAEATDMPGMEVPNRTAVNEMSNRNMQEEIPNVNMAEGMPNRTAAYEMPKREFGNEMSNLNRNQNMNGMPVYGAYKTSAEEASFHIESKKERKKKEKAEKLEAKKRKKASTGTSPFKKVVAVSLSAVLFGVVGGATFIGVNYFGNKYVLPGTTQVVNGNVSETVAETTESKPGLTTANNEEKQPANISTVTTSSNAMTVEQIAENCMSSIVAITNVGVSEVQTFWGTYQTESQSTGSGIIIGETDSELLIVTNYHVVSGSNELTVVFSYDEANTNPNAVEAKIKGYDANRDLAVIAVEMNNLSSEVLNQISIAVVGESSDLKLGEQVVAIGNALGYGQSVTVGYVSALNRIINVETENGGTSANAYIQTDAAINPGNSGGALFNMKGELIGINSVKVASSEVEGMGYAIPISDVQDIISQLMTIETRDVVDAENRGYLGIKGQSVTAEISQFGIPVGAYINEVASGSSAEKGGILAGDVITEFDGKTIGSFETLQDIIQYYAAGETVEVTVMRQSSGGYEEVHLTLTLCSAEEAGISASSVETSEGPNQDSNGAYNFGNDNGASGNETPDSDYYNNLYDYFFGR